MAMAIALAAVIVVWVRHAHATPRAIALMEAMNLFVGVTLLVMGIGHLLAVTTKLLQGTLERIAGAALPDRRRDRAAVVV